MLALEEYYFLLHGFDRVGRRLYDAEWTGVEFDQAEIDAPEIVAAALAPYENRLKEIGAQLDQLADAKERTLRADEIDAHTETMQALFTERGQLQSRLLSMQKLDESYERDRAAYERRIKTEEVLFGALASGAVRAQAGRSVLIDWESWSRDRGFKCYLGLSMVVLAKRHNAGRRAAVLFRRAEFDRWLSTIPAARPSGAPLPIEDRCEAWLRELIARSGGRKPGSKKSIYEDAKKDFRGRLPWRVFDDVWKRVAPPEWRRIGAPAHSELKQRA